MKQPILILIALLVTNYALAQSDEILEAVTVKNTILMDIVDKNGKKALAIVGNSKNTDALKWDFAQPDSGPLILLRENNYTIQTRVNNPLRYMVAITGGIYETDTYTEVLNSLAQNFQSILGILQITPSTQSEKPIGTEIESKASTFESAFVDLKTMPRKVNLTSKNSKQLKVHDAGVRRGILGTGYLNDPKQYEIPELQATVSIVEDAVSTIEGKAYSDISLKAGKIINELSAIDLATENASGSIAELKKLIEELRKDNVDLATMVSNLGGLSNLITLKEIELNSERKKRILELLKDPTVRGDYERLIESMFSSIDFETATISSFQSPTAEESLEVLIDSLHADNRTSILPRDSYSLYWLKKTFIPMLEFEVEQFATRINSLVDERRALIENLDKLYKLVVDASAIASKSEHGVVRSYSNRLPADKTETISISITDRAIKLNSDFTVSIDENEIIKKEFKLSKARSLYPQLFPGVVFVNESITSFTADQDSSGVIRVNSSTSSPGYVNWAAMVNFNINYGDVKEVPFIQIGASAKKMRPQALFGLGFRFSDWFCLSGGMVLTWLPSLTALSEGAVVSSQEALENDFSYSLSKPRAYFGIQLRPSALTKND